MSRTKWKCLDCHIDTGKIGEHYYLLLTTWKLVMNTNKGMLCIKCFEKRLGRRLNPSDFTKCSLNEFQNGEKSQLLTNRLRGL